MNKRAYFGATPSDDGSGPARKPRINLDDSDDDVKPADTSNAEEIDPLDAFMAEINADLKTQASNPTVFVPKPEVQGGDDDDILAAEPARRPSGADADDDEVYAMAQAEEDDTADDPVATGGHYDIAPLPFIDHNALTYEDFNKDFYNEHADIRAMSDAEVAQYRRELDVRVTGIDPPRPVRSFVQLGLDKITLQAVAKEGYESPTAIQCQAIPAALSGRDIIALSKTGSGKTAAYILPMITHVMDQREIEKGEGCIAMILVPTRELGMQVCTETKKFARGHGVKVCALLTGMSKFEQIKELRNGVEVIVATPGRMIEMLRKKMTNLERCTYVVLDEADRMFDLGFEVQVRSLLSAVRPTRQTMLFSATFKSSIEALCSAILTDPIRISVGSGADANADVLQEIIVLKDAMGKWPWMAPRLKIFEEMGSVLIFVGQKKAAQELSENLNRQGFKTAALHGDLTPQDRQTIMHAFRHNTLPILVATDVAARGLDVKTVHVVINYDIPKDIETHIHRVGRTGRAGDKDGVAFTLITHGEDRFAGDLVRCLEGVGQQVPPELLQLAMQNAQFGKRSGARGGRGGKGGGRGGRGGASSLPVTQTNFGGMSMQQATSTAANQLHAKVNTHAVPPPQMFHQPQKFGGYQNFRQMQQAKLQQQAGAQAQNYMTAQHRPGFGAKPQQATPLTSQQLSSYPNSFVRGSSDAPPPPPPPPPPQPPQYRR